MVKLYDWDEVHKLAGQFMKECAREVLKQGKRGTTSTRANFREVHACVRRKFEEYTRQKIASL